MKVLRRLLVVAGIAVLALAALVAVAFNSSFQTWAARRTLAAHPDARTTLGSASLGLRQVDLRDLEYRNGAAILRVPRVLAEVPLWPAGLNRQLHVGKLHATGWTLDLSRLPEAALPSTTAPSSAGPSPTASSIKPPPGALFPAAEAAKAFAGVFAHLGLPIDLTLDGVVLDGEVILPAGRGRVKIAVRGGGLAVGREGVFTVTATAALAAADVSRVELHATLRGTMDSPRSFTRLALALAAEATGTQFPTGAKLAVDVSASRAAGSESYSAAVVAGLRELMKLEAAFPPGGNRIEGAWRLEVRDADLLPFVLGQPLPAFALSGEGRLAADAALVATRITGRLEATAGSLQVIAPPLAQWGNVAVVTQFDVTRRQDGLLAERLEATLGAAQPIATVRALQPFEYRPATREFRPTHADRALLGATLHAVPVEWARPWLDGVAVTGGPVRGELRVWSQPGGGVGVRTEAPLTLGTISLHSGNRPWLRDLSLTVAGAADFSREGWQLDLSRFELSQGETKLASLVAKLGRLAGPEHALKSTGHLALHLAPLSRQPLAGPDWALAAGEATIDYSASLGLTQQLVAKFQLSQLAATSGESSAKLPRITGDLRTDIGASGRTEFRLPLTFVLNDRTSDALVAGTLETAKPDDLRLDATVASQRLALDDVRALAAIFPQDSAAKPEPSKRSPWAGLSGTLALALKEVILDDTFTVRGLTGRVRLDAGTVKLEEVQGGLGDTGRVNLNGALSFDAGAERPFGVAAEISARDVESGLLFRDHGTGRPSPIEGRFDVTSRIAGRARRLAELAREAGGETSLSSRGGLFRGLPIAFTSPAGPTGRLAGIVASAGSVLSGFTGRKEPAEIASRPHAVAELARARHPIAFDQLSLVLTRDAARNTTLRDFVLIAPELRLTGGGTALHRPGDSLLTDALAMEFKLHARGRQGDLLKFLGVLDTRADELGYLPCTMPLRIAGSVARPDASETNVKLAALALERGSVTEKASELFNRVFGGGK